MSEVFIDVPEIRKNIQKKHAEFLLKFEGQSLKANADRSLLIETVITRLYRISMCFFEEGIIDTPEIIPIDGGRKKITLSKNGNIDRIDLFTDGEGILITESGNKMMVPYQECLYNINNENFDWTAFSNLLLDGIHAVIYDREDACEIKAFDTLRNLK